MGKKNLVPGKGTVLLADTGLILFTCRYLPACEKEVSLCPTCQGVLSRLSLDDGGSFKRRPAVPRRSFLRRLV